MLKSMNGVAIYGQQSCPRATVTVRVAGTSTLATIYSDGAGTAKVNPFTASATGFYSGYADDGAYDILVDCAAQTISGVLSSAWSTTSTITVGSGGTQLVSVETFGAVADALWASSGSMSSGSSTLTIGLALFTSADVGKRICVSGTTDNGTANDVPTCGTISAYGSTTSVTTSFTNASGGAISNKFVIWGTDNTAAFVSTAAALSTSGGVFYIPAGDYNSTAGTHKGYLIRSNQLTFSVTGTHVRGDGWSSIVYRGDNDNSALVTGVANAAIYSDFKIWDGYTDWTHTGAALKLDSPGNDVSVQRMWFRSSYDLIWQNKLDNVMILDSILEDSRRYAVRWYQASTSKMLGNSLYACSSDSTIANNANVIVEKDGAYAFKPHHNIIANNYFQYSRYGHFIRLSEANGTKIDGNFFHLAGMFNANTADDINFATDSDYTTITGNSSSEEYNNYIADNRATRYVVNVDADSTDVKVVGNGFQAGLSGAVNIAIGAGVEVIASTADGNAINLRRAIAGAYQKIVVFNTSATGQAQLQLSAGNGTSSGRYANVLFQSSESSAINWLVGMQGTQDFTINKGSPALYHIFINSVTDAITFGSAVTAAEGLTVPTAKYLQFQFSGAGAPTAGDCDADAERGRFYLETTNNRLYVCNGAARGWDYVGLTN